MNGKPTRFSQMTTSPGTPASDAPDFLASDLQAFEAFERSQSTHAQATSTRPNGDAARAAIVNRTRRVVREQALGMRTQRQKTRSLWVPMAICSTLLLVICYAIWAVLDGYDLTPNGVPDASDQMLLLLLWGLPITIVALGLAWLRRGRTSLGSEVSQ